MIKDILKEAFILKEKGYYKYAIESFYKALELDNNSVELLLDIADCYYLMNDYERAVGYIEQILEKNPTHIESLKLLKKIFIDKKAWNEAEQTTKNIYCISKNLDDLAEIFRFLNKQKRYSEIFEYNTEEYSDKLYYEMAYAKYKILEFEDAENYINKAIELNAKDDYYLLKGKILFKQNKEDDCIPLLEKLNDGSDNPELLNFLGLIAQYQGEYKKAVNCFLKAIKILPKNHEYYYNCASTYFKMSEKTYAKKYYNLAISLAPDNQNYHFALANLYYSERNFKRAFEELNYDFFEANLLKSIILYDTGYVALAKKALLDLQKENANNPIVIEYLAKIEEDLKI